MDRRREELSALKNDTLKIDKEVTLLLQNLQWDREHFLKPQDPIVTCSFDKGHRFPNNCKERHEAKCAVTSQGYTGALLPDPPGSNVPTAVKLNREDIQRIIHNASMCNPQFITEIDKAQHDCYIGSGLGNPSQVEPMTLERLQSTYTSDERRAIHDAVIATAPTHVEDMTDMPMPSGGEARTSGAGGGVKSRSEVLAELRDMKRRRAKYRGATNTSKYSDVLRDVIRAQMEAYTEVQTEKLMKHVKTEKEHEEAYSRGQQRDGYNHKSQHYCQGSHKDRHDKKYNQNQYDSRSENDRKREHSQRERDRYRHRSRSPSHSKHEKRSRNESRNYKDDYRRDDYERIYSSNRDRKSSSHKSKRDEIVHKHKTYDEDRHRNAPHKRYYDT